MKHLGSLSSSSASASLSASLTVYSLPPLAYVRIGVNEAGANVRGAERKVDGIGRCDSSLEAGLNRREADILVEV